MVQKGSLQKRDAKGSSTGQSSAGIGTQSSTVRAEPYPVCRSLDWLLSDLPDMISTNYYIISKALDSGSNKKPIQKPTGP